MVDKYTAQAPTKEEAITKALTILDIAKEDAIIEVNVEARKGFLGIGQKDAVVTVKRKEVDHLESVLAEAKKINIKPTDNPTIDIPDKTDKSHVSKEVTIEENKSEESNDEKLTSVTENQESNTVEVDQTEEVSPEVNPEDQKAIEHVHHYLNRIIEAMGIDDADIMVEQDNERVRYEISTEDAGLVIGRHGKVLNGLQRLAQVQLLQHADNRLFVRVDAEDYRSRRRNTIEHLAEKTAQKVKRTKQPVILEPMPAHERKQIHRYLNQYSDIKTHSEGKEPHRYLVVESAQ